MIKILWLCAFSISQGVIFAQLEKTFSDTFCTLAASTDSAAQKKILQTKNADSTTKISFADYFILLNDALQHDFLSPFHQSGKSWKNIGIYAASLTAFSFAFDEPVQVFASNLRNKSSAMRATSGFITKFGGSYGLYSLGAFGAYSFLFHSNKLQTTTLLATQAYITSGLLETGLKYITGRQRPTYYNPKDDGAEPAFHGPLFSFGNNLYKTKISTAFPSGHTTVAFAVATVFAKEYHSTPWVPVFAYSTASLVGLSRITQNAHWITDVLAGATLGYLSGLQVVHNFHHYEQMKSKRNSGTLSFNLNYNGYNFQPGLVYAFRH